MASVQPAVKALLCSAVGASYTASLVVHSHLQTDCHYPSAFLIQYFDDAFIGVLAVLALAAIEMPSRAEVRRLLPLQLPWAFLLAALALVANVSFMVALRLTSSSSAAALEQLCALFIAALSYCLLKARYPLLAILMLLVAVGGAVLAVLGDAQGVGGGSLPLVGDALSLIVATCAGLYMVLFKLAFPTMRPQEFLFFFALKGIITTAFGWIGVVLFNVVGWESAAWPTGCAAIWLPVGALLAACFNWLLSWTTLRLSPLMARLSLLLGAPCAFVIDLALGRHKAPAGIAGMFLVVLGVVGFEIASSRADAQACSPDDAEARAQLAD